GQFHEARNWFDAALESERPSALVMRARALFWAGRLSILQAEWSRAAELLAEAHLLAETIGDNGILALALGKEAWVTAEVGDPDAARPLADESLALARAGGDAWTTAELLNDVGLSSDRDEPDRALRASAESLELRRRLGSEFDVADSLNNLGYMLAYTGRTNEARKFLDEGLALAERIGDM